MPSEVTDSTSEEQQGAEGQRVTGDDPLQVRRNEVQLARDGRKRHVDDAEVKLENELRSDDKPKSQPYAKDRRCTGVRGLCGCGIVRSFGHATELSDRGPLLSGRRGSPQIDTGVDGVAIDGCELISSEIEVIECCDVLLELGDAARAYQHRSDSGVAQGPCDCHLGKGLTALQGDVVEGSDPCEVVIVEHVERE